MSQIREISANFCSRYAAKLAVLTLLGFVTVGCADDQQQRVSTEQKPGQTMTVAKADQSAVDPNKAPVPALAANSYRATPYFFPPMGGMMPGSR